VSLILDQFPYPWADRTAQQLHVTLTKLHPTPAGAVMLAQQAGIDIGYVNAQQPPAFVWHDILDLAGQGGLTRALVTTVRDLLNPQNPQRPFFDSLLTASATPIDTEPRNADGTGIFIRGDDAISDHEALLFRDDLMLETGRLPALISTLQVLLRLAPAVCRIEAKFAGGTGLGTGFRIGSDLVLTNWHVLHDSRNGGTRTESVMMNFDYEDDGGGGMRPSAGLPGDVSTIVTDSADDWAIIRPTQPLGDAIPTLTLSQSVDPIQNEAAFIVQHPGGRGKRLGYVRNQVSDFDDHVIHYLTDTEPGSSGSPVFNASGLLIGLHHAGGAPQTVVGRPPINKNEGIRIPRVVEGLRAQGIVAP
jgi:hypothetical protein